MKCNMISAGQAIWRLSMTDLLRRTGTRRHRLATQLWQQRSSFVLIIRGRTVFDLMPGQKESVKEGFPGGREPGQKTVPQPVGPQCLCGGYQDYISHNK